MLKKLLLKPFASLNQPIGLYFLFFIELWERYGFYTVNGLLVLFMSHSMHLTDKQSYQVFAAVGALLYVSPMIGGAIADKYLGYHESLTIGAVLLIVGYGLLGIPNTHFFSLALAILVVGMGFFKFAPSVMLGKLYNRNNSSLNAGYTLFYMGINVGSFLAFIFSGVIANEIGWHAAFFSAALGVIIGLSVYLYAKKRGFINIGNTRTMPSSVQFKIILIIGIIAAITVATVLIGEPKLANIFVILASLGFLYYLYAARKHIDKQQRRNVLLAVILSIIAIAFFVLYCQQPMTVTLFTDRNVVHKFLGMNLPTSAFESLNPLWIMILSPIAAKVYQQLGKNKRDPEIAYKYAIGIIIMGFGYLSLAFSTYFHNSQEQVSPLWLVLSYGLQSTAELLVSALGLAMISRFAPAKLVGIMMGGWFIAQAAGSLIGGQVSQLADIPEHINSPALSLTIYHHAFLHYGLASIVLGAIVLLAAPMLMRLAKPANEEGATDV